MILAALLTAIQVPNIAIEHVSIVQPGSEVLLRDQTVIFHGDKIVRVGGSDSVTSPKNAQVIDGKGKFLIPGLWDMHVHLMDEKGLKLFTANGVTGIRVMFGAPHQLTWRRQVETGEMLGPRMVVGSPIVDGPKPVWPGSIAVRTAEEGKKAVQKIKKDGYDFVKVYSLIPREAYFGIAEEAKKQKIAFEGHVPHAISILEAAKTGQRTAEHMMNLSMESSTREEELRHSIAGTVVEGFPALVAAMKKISPQVIASYDAKKLTTFIQELSHTKMWQCPTLVVLRATAYLDEVTPGQDPRFKYMPAFLTASWDPKKDFRFLSRTPDDWAAAKRTFKGNEQVLAMMHKAKVPILAGSDCYNPYTFPGFSIHDELTLLVKAGLKPTEALATATTNPARYYNIERVAGTISQGKRADMVLLSANPLEDIGNTKKIVAVIQRGKVMDRTSLDSILKSCEY